MGLVNPVVNFRNILQADFAPIFFAKKLQKPNCKWIKAVANTFVQKTAHKMFMIWTPLVNFNNIL